MAAGQPPAPPPLRLALHAIDQHVDDYITHARLGKAAWKLDTTVQELGTKDRYAPSGTSPGRSGPLRAVRLT